MASTPNAALLRAFQGMQENSYSTWAAFTLAAYDFLITFPYELRLVWRRPWNATNVLFLTTRWIMVAGAIAVVAPKAPTSNCHVVLWVDQILGYISFAQTAAFSALRIFAIWQRNYALAAVIFALGCVPIAGNIYLAGFHNTIGFVSRPVSECIETITVSEDNLMMYVSGLVINGLHISRGCAIAMDGLVLVLTWLKTFRQWREARRLNIALSASTCLLRDGTWYFCGLLAMNIAEMATIRTVGTPLSSCLVQVLPSALVNHFIINLRSLNPAEASISGELPLSQISSLHIRMPDSFLGNIGEDLDYREGVYMEDAVTEISSTLESVNQDSSAINLAEKLDGVEVI